MRPATLLGLVAPDCPRCATPRPCGCDDRREREHVDRRVRVKARQLELTVRNALSRIAWAWTDDRDVYERAVGVPNLRAIGERWTPERGSLLVLGTTGSGKSASVARALRRLVRAAASESDSVLGVMWTSAADLAHARRRHRIGSGEAPLIEAAIEAPILVVDELGVEPASEAIFELYDARYRRAVPTLTTSGMSREQLVARYGDGLVRRMTAPFGATVEAWS